MNFATQYKAMGRQNTAQVMLMAFFGDGQKGEPQAGRAPHANRPTPPRRHFPPDQRPFRRDRRVRSTAYPGNAPLN